MKTYLAYIDESGDPNFTPGATKTILLGAVVFPQDELDSLSERLRVIKGKYSVNELKSSAIGSPRRRADICSELAALNLKFVTVHVDKTRLTGRWFRYRPTFYKYLQRILNSDVHRLFGDVQTKIDQFGSTEYQRSLRNYLHVSLQRELFSPSVQVASAKIEEFIQVADFLSGTLRKLHVGDFAQSPEVERSLATLWLSRRVIPDTGKYVAVVEDNEISVCLQEARRFLESSEYPDSDPKIITLDYLYHEALANPDRWVFTHEIQGWLAGFGLTIGEEQFRNEITAFLRDNGVVVVGSRRGLKIPTCAADIREYADFSIKLALPVLRRLKRALHLLEARQAMPDAMHMLSDEVRAILEKVDA